jgi:hypothetical protein
MSFVISLFVRLFYGLSPILKILTYLDILERLLGGGGGSAHRKVCTYTGSAGKMWIYDQKIFLFNIILQSTTKPSECSRLFRFSGQNLVCISHPSNACYVPRPSHPPLK